LEGKLWPQGRRILCVCVTLLAAYAPGASADRFHLSSDRILEGILVSEDDSTVSFELEGAGLWTLSRKSVIKVERETPGAYWIRTGESHVRGDRPERAQRAFRKALKDPTTKTLAKLRLSQMNKGSNKLSETLFRSFRKLDFKFPKFRKEPDFSLKESAQSSLVKTIEAEPTEFSFYTYPDEDPHYVSIAKKNARRFGVDPLLVRAVIAIESSWNPNCTSTSGAMGLMQLMPETADYLGVRNAYDPEENIRGGVEYLSKMLNEFDNPNWKVRRIHAIAAYNAGPNRLREVGDYRLIPETKRYVKKVLAAYNHLRK